MAGNSNIFIIESDIKNLTQVEFYLNDFFKKNNLSMSIFNKIYLCISEAVINSIVHGNNGNRNKNVTIKMKYTGNFLKVMICDEGNGFNISGLKDPTCNENVRKEFGRGIHIIRSYAETLKYRKNCCFLRFKV